MMSTTLVLSPQVGGRHREGDVGTQPAGGRVSMTPVLSQQVGGHGEYDTGTQSAGGGEVRHRYSVSRPRQEIFQDR